MRVNAAVLHETRTPFRIQSVELSPPREGEVLVRMEAAGVCHSDWHVATGDSKMPLPVVAGHEGAGVVEAVGQGVTRVRKGQRVVLCWAPHCGTCYHCTHDRKCLCPAYTANRWNGVLMDGSPRLALSNGTPVYHFCSIACFADHAVVHESSCVPVDDELDPGVGALVGCAVTTGVGAVVRTAKVPAGATVAVFGVGGVGLCIVMAARIAGAAMIIAIDPEESRLAMAEKFGATHTIKALRDGGAVNDEIKSLTGGLGADYAFEAVGLPAVQEQSLAAVRAGGTVVLAGLSPMGSSTNLPGAILTRREIMVMGSYYGTADPDRDFPLYIDWHRRGDLPIDQLITARYPLTRINEAYDDMLNGRNTRGGIAR
mgnify:CR=1 FL=1